MIYPYTWREPSDCTPPRDVLDILGAPAGVTQVRIIVFASSQKTAWGYLDRLDLAPRSHRALGPAHGEDVRALIAFGCNRPGSTFGVYRTAVVAIQLLGDVESTGRGRRVLRIEDRIEDLPVPNYVDDAVPLALLPKNGDTCTENTMGGSCGYPLLIDGACANAGNHRDVVEAVLAEDPESIEDPEVTDAMVRASFDALDDLNYCLHDAPDMEQMRVAIAAALAARED